MRLVPLVLITLIGCATVGAQGFPALEPVHLEHVEGAVAYGVTVDSPGGGFSLFLQALGPAVSSHASVGIYQVGDSGASLHGGTYTVAVRQDGMALTVLDAPLPFPADVDALVSPPAPDEGSLLGFGISAIRPPPPAGEYHFVVWSAGGTASTLEVHGTNGTTVRLTPARAHVVGDADLRMATANAQARQSVAEVEHPVWWRHNLVELNPGAKVLVNASVEMAVNGNLYGAWRTVQPKLTCLAGACAWESWAQAACMAATGVGCGTEISFDGPGRVGRGSLAYDFHGEPPGKYVFRVDRDVDAFGLGAFEPLTALALDWQEGTTYLSAVAVPAGFPSATQGA